jgi:hypothetical protein
MALVLAQEWDNVFHPPYGPLLTPKRGCQLQHTIAPPHRIISPQKEGRLALTIHSLNKKQIKSQRSAAETYIISRTTLQRRYRDIPPKQGSRAKNQLLLKCDEEELIK